MIRQLTKLHYGRSFAAATHIGRRAAGGGTPRHEAPRKGLVLASIGSVGGAVGALVGIGGGNVMVPLMTMFSTNLTQHQIIATSLAAVVSTGSASAVSYLSAGAVDLTAASLIAVSASFTSPLGARLASRLSGPHLRLCLSLFVLGSAPLVLLREQDKKMSVLQTDRCGMMDLSEALSSQNGHNTSFQSKSVVVFAGVLAGLASGLLGIGGGVVLTPALAMATDLPQLTVLGTSLTAMIVPSLAGAYVHYRAGAIHVANALPLACGAAVGASVGGRFAAQVRDEDLRLVFSVVMSVVGAHMLRNALKGLR